MPRDFRPWLVVLLCGGFLLLIVVTVGPFVGGKPRPSELSPAKEETGRRILGTWKAGVDPWKTLSFADKGYRLSVMNDSGPRTPDEVGEYVLVDGSTLELRPEPFQAAPEPVKDKDLPIPSVPEPRPSRRYMVHIEGDELRLESDGDSETWRRDGK